ncbi:MAG: hypothetical protein Q3999_00790 [Buchananella hordeovulneris]|nr:hypothetical protein [Buchananella hordeovulneris]
MDAQWIPGDFVGAVCPGGALLAEDVDPRSVVAAWEALRAGQALEAVAQQLVVSPRPSSQLRYAVTTWDGTQLRVLVSTGFAVRVHLADREELISPTELDSPALAFAGVSRWELSDAWYAEVGSDQDPVPVRDGVVFAEALLVTPARSGENEAGAPGQALPAAAGAGEERSTQEVPAAAPPQFPGGCAAPGVESLPQQHPTGQSFAAPLPQAWAPGGEPGGAHGGVSGEELGGVPAPFGVPQAPTAAGAPGLGADPAAQFGAPGQLGQPGYAPPAEFAAPPQFVEAAPAQPLPTPEQGHTPFPGAETARQDPSAAAWAAPQPSPAPAGLAWGQPINAEDSPFAPSGAPAPVPGPEAPGAGAFISGVPSQFPVPETEPSERWGGADDPSLAGFAPPA